MRVQKKDGVFVCFLLGGLSYQSVTQAAHLAPIKAVVTLRNPMELWVNRSFALSMLQFTLVHKNTLGVC